VRFDADKVGMEYVFLSVSLFLSPNNLLSLPHSHLLSTHEMCNIPNQAAHYHIFGLLNFGFYLAWLLGRLRNNDVNPNCSFYKKTEDISKV
jgi:hypothetical protein